MVQKNLEEEKSKDLLLELDCLNFDLSLTGINNLSFDLDINTIESNSV